MPIMRGHFWYRQRILQNDLVENIGTIFGGSGTIFVEI